MNLLKSDRSIDITSDRMRLTDTFPDIANHIGNQDDQRQKTDEMKIQDTNLPQVIM